MLLRLLHKCSRFKFKSSTILAGLILSVFTYESFALPETCIQNPRRKMECPRLIYKLAELKDKETGVVSKELVCICLTDFEDILVEPESNLAKTLKESDIRSWAAEFGLTAEQLKELVKY